MPRLYQSCRPLHETYFVSWSKAGLGDDSLSFCALVALASFEILELLDAAVRPLDRDAVGLVFLAEAESERQFGLRKIAGAALYHPRLGDASAFETDNRSDGVAIGLGADEAEAEAVVPALRIEDLIVAEKIRRTVVGGEEQVEVAVAIEVCIGEAAPDFRLAEVGTSFTGDVTEGSIALVEKQLWRLGVADIAANVSDGVVDVAVGDGEIEGAVEVKVGEDASEPEHIFGGGAQAGRDGNVIVRSFAGRSIESEHFIVEVRDGDARAARVGEIGGIDAHAGTSFAVGAEGDARVHGDFFEGTVTVVAIKLVGLRVVRDDEVGPAVLIVVEEGDAQRFRTAVEDSAGRCDVFESSVAAIVEKPAGLSAIGFRSAIGLVFAVETAKHVVVGRPLDIVADEEIETAVAVVIEPESRSTESLAVAESGGPRHVYECAFAGIAEQTILTHARNQDVGQAVVVVVADGDAHAIHVCGVESGSVRHVCKSAIAIVAVELESRARGVMSRPIGPVDEEDVRPAIGVIVEEGTAGPESLW